MGRAGLLVGAAVLVAAGVGVWQGAVPCEVLDTQPACEVALHPGPTEDALPLLEIPDAEVHRPDDGALQMPTIAVVEDLSWGQWVTWRASDVIDVVPRASIFPEEDPAETAERNAAMMRDSQQAAVVAALRHLGYEVPGEGAEVVGHASDTRAGDVEVGEVITAVNGTAVSSSQDVIEVLDGVAPGETVTLGLIDPGSGEQRREVVEVGAAPDGSGRAYLGVLLTTDLELPLDVAIDAGTVGGPSAGLVFALSIIELLDAGELTDGHVVAATGTIGIDGTVGPVGGVPQKLAGVTTDAEAPAEVFLVPRANLAQARAAHVEREVLLVPVDDLADAVSALERFGDGGQPAGAEVLAAG